MDVARLRESFARVAMHGDELPMFFYSDLFIKHPEVRDMFPVSMAAQRGRFVEALMKIVSQVDRVDELTAPSWRRLGRDHRRFGAVTEHYQAVGASLLATMEHFSGPAWTPELAADWKTAYDLIGSVMLAAASADEQVRPAWWRGTVVASERKAFDISVLLVQPEPQLDYLPGQSVAIECPSRPRLWRYYSIANAPRPDGLLEFHIRLIDGGAVSMALTSASITDTALRIGAPIGALTLSQPPSGRDLLHGGRQHRAGPAEGHPRAGGRPAAAAEGAPVLRRPVPDGLYDLDSLEKMAAQHPWLTVTPSVSGDLKFAGETGSLPDVVARTATGQAATPTWPGRPRWSGRPWTGWSRPACRKSRSISRTLAGVSLDHSMVRRAGQADSRGAADGDIPDVTAGAARVSTRSRSGRSCTRCRPSSCGW